MPADPLAPRRGRGGRAASPARRPPCAWWVMNTRRASSPRPSCSGRADADAVLGEHARDGVQHAGPVDDLEREVVLGRRLVDGADRRLGERAERAVGALAQVDGGVDDVAEHGAGRRQPAGAAAVEHELSRRRRPRRTRRCSCRARWPAGGWPGTIAGCTRTDDLAARRDPARDGRAA